MRTGPGQWFAEVVATFGLVVTILAALRFRPDAIPWLVGLYITAAYWFTASTSFANPAVAIARAFTDTFAGIRPADLPGFIVAEIVGASSRCCSSPGCCEQACPATKSVRATLLKSADQR